MCYGHMGRVKAICEQYSLRKIILPTMGLGSYCYEIKRNENLRLKFRYQRIYAFEMYY